MRRNVRVRHGYILLTMSFLCAVAIFTACQTGSRKKDATADPISYGKMDYDWRVHTLSGEPLDMSSLQDQVIYLHIWATWCPPCVDELPEISGLIDRVNHPDIRYILISPESPDRISGFLTENSLNLPAYHLSTELPAVFQEKYIPRTYIIDRFGTIVFKQIGSREWSDPEFGQFLDFLARARIRSAD